MYLCIENEIYRTLLEKKRIQRRGLLDKTINYLWCLYSTARDSIKSPFSTVVTYMAIGMDHQAGPRHVPTVHLHRASRN